LTIILIHIKNEYSKLREGAMYVCLCNAVTDHEIRAEIRQGACTMRELRDRLGVTTGCGRCGPSVLAILSESVTDGTQQGVAIEADVLFLAQV
jgi:bacterioferritin-associated ferredoxin